MTRNIKEEEEKNQVQKSGNSIAVASDFFDVSALATKSKSGKVLKRHCVPCGALIVNWSDHKTKAHGGTEVPYSRCDAFCK